MFALRDQIAAENAALGVVAFHPAICCSRKWSGSRTRTTVCSNIAVACSNARGGSDRSAQRERRRRGRPARRLLRGVCRGGPARTEPSRRGNRNGRPDGASTTARVMAFPVNAFPIVRETRPRRPRSCLRCGRRFPTTAATRLCRNCTDVIEDLQAGAVTAAGRSRARKGKGGAVRAAPPPAGGSPPM